MNSSNGKTKYCWIWRRYPFLGQPWYTEPAALNVLNVLKNNRFCYRFLPKLANSDVAGAFEMPQYSTTLRIDVRTSKKTCEMRVTRLRQRAMRSTIESGALRESAPFSLGVTGQPKKVIPHYKVRTPLSCRCKRDISRVSLHVWIVEIREVEGARCCRSRRKVSEESKSCCSFPYIKYK